MRLSTTARDGGRTRAVGSTAYRNLPSSPEDNLTKTHSNSALVTQHHETSMTMCRSARHLLVAQCRTGIMHMVSVRLEFVVRLAEPRPVPELAHLASHGHVQAAASLAPATRNKIASDGASVMTMRRPQLILAIRECLTSSATVYKSSRTATQMRRLRETPPRRPYLAAARTSFTGEDSVLDRRVRGLMNAAMAESVRA